MQNFADRLSMPQGDQTLPITMTIYNGGPEQPAFKWFRIIVNEIVIASEKDMQGREIALKDLSGVLHGSDLQVQIQGGGVPGSHLYYTLSVPQLDLSYAEPQQVSPGQSLKLMGHNFPSDPNMLIVMLNNQELRPSSASNNSITVVVPQAADIGVNRVTVYSGKISSNPISVSIISRPVPEILAVDCWMAPPGGSINISGRNFSANSTGDKVFFGQVEGQVTFASPTQLTVTVPNWSYGPSQLNIPLSVEVNGVRSSNTYPFDIGPSYHGAIPQFGHD